MPSSLVDCKAKDLHKLSGGDTSNGVGGMVEVKTPDAVQIACCLVLIQSSAQDRIQSIEAKAKKGSQCEKAVKRWPRHDTMAKGRK
jgi:hypothetical protein